jgi:hypothetical protein
MQCCAGIPAPSISWNNWVTKLTVSTGRQFVPLHYDKKASVVSPATYCFYQAKVKDYSTLKFESCDHVIHYENVNSLSNSCTETLVLYFSLFLEKHTVRVSRFTYLSEWYLRIHRKIKKTKQFKHFRVKTYKKHRNKVGPIA